MLKLEDKIKMNEPNENAPRRYKWPWYVLGAFILFVLLAIVWMSFAVRMVEQKRNQHAPPPTNSAQWPL